MSEHRFYRAAYYGFIVLAWLFTVSVAVQVLFAGLALFFDSGYWRSHAGFARFAAVLPLMMIMLAWGGRLHASWIRRSVGLLGITIAMFLTAVLSARIEAVSALHPVLALMLFSVSMSVLRSFRR